MYISRVIRGGRVPGIIVSRAVFNTLFGMAHEDGLSINAFLTRAISKSGSTADRPRSPGHPVDALAGGMSLTPFESLPVRDQRAERGGAVAAPPARRGSRHSAIWAAVQLLSGRELRTLRGMPFTFSVVGDGVVVRESQTRIPRSQFERALEIWPVRGPSRLTGIYAPSLVWSVLNRIHPAVPV